MTNLTIYHDLSYPDGEMCYEVSTESKGEFSFKIPEEINSCNIPNKIIGYLSYYFHSDTIDFQEEVLELHEVYPLKYIPKKRNTGLGSFALSQTLNIFYQDALRGKILKPNKRIIVDTTKPELIGILERRGFVKKSLDGYVSTIQAAAEASEKIMHERNWI